MIDKFEHNKYFFFKITKISNNIQVNINLIINYNLIQFTKKHKLLDLKNIK